MSRGRVLWSVVLAIVGAPVLARADTVVVDGIRLEGDVIAVTSRSVSLRLAGATIALARDRVGAVTLNERRAPAGGLPVVDLGFAAPGPRGAAGGGDRLLMRARALAASGETERALRLARSAREGRVASPALEDLERSMRVEEATAALGSGCAARALGVLGPLDARGDPGFAFVLGRCRDELGDGPGAGESFGALLDTVGIPSVGLALPVRRELARFVAADGTGLARLVHETVAPPARLRLLESEHVSVLDVGEGATPDLAALERQRTATLGRLGFEEREVPALRHLVAVTGPRARLGPLFSALGLADWVGACAGLARGPGGAAPHVFSARPLCEVFAHELTHLVVAAHRGADSLPAWAEEGVAVWADPAGAASLRRAGGAPFRLVALLALDNVGLQRLDRRRADLFYAQALVLFEACRLRLGTARAVLELARTPPGTGVSVVEARLAAVGLGWNVVDALMPTVLAELAPAAPR